MAQTLPTQHHDCEYVLEGHLCETAVVLQHAFKGLHACRSICIDVISTLEKETSALYTQEE